MCRRLTSICTVQSRRKTGHAGDLAVSDNISLLFLPPYSPELNPKENLWDETRDTLQELCPQVHLAESSSRRSSISRYRAQSRKLNPSPHSPPSSGLSDLEVVSILPAPSAASCPFRKYDLAWEPQNDKGHQTKSSRGKHTPSCADRLAGGASTAPGSALKQTSSIDHSEEPTHAPRSCNVPGIFGIERLHP
jgi:DDE superfamily endonuclease